MGIRKKVTIAETVRQNRKGIPEEQREVKSREDTSAIFMQNDKNNIFLVSYIDKKKSGKKIVVLLTTMHDTVKVINDEI